MNYTVNSIEETYNELELVDGLLLEDEYGKYYINIKNS